LRPPGCFISPRFLFFSFGHKRTFLPEIAFSPSPRSDFLSCPSLRPQSFRIRPLQKNLGRQFTPVDPFSPIVILSRVNCPLEDLSQGFFFFPPPEPSLCRHASDGTSLVLSPFRLLLVPNPTPFWCVGFSCLCEVIFSPFFSTRRSLPLKP